MQKNRKQQEQKWINGIRLFGSKKDADQLVRSYYDEIYIFVFRQINDAEKALDLTQDIFISMLQSIPAYNKQMSSFRTWLYRIATNKVIDYRKKYVPIAVGRTVKEDREICLQISSVNTANIQATHIW